MNAAVRSFVGGEVAESDNELPDDALPLWESSTRLVLVTSAGCQPCELQKQSMPDDVRYETLDIAKANAEGYNIRVTPTLMVFVDGNLEHTTSGLLRGDRLRAFLDRWGFTDNEAQPDDTDLSDDLNPWSNPHRWDRGPVRDRIEDAKDRFAWWLLAKWLGFAGGGSVIALPWLFFIYRALRKVRSSENEKPPPKQPQSRQRSPRRPRKPTR
ncbi:thioredoxin family protein [Neorhodopirellula lusitana]|uniref:thioredoxin family protein n=1 Tax=Neorhodopirellula lusitana TaxID=445327 RepID=UPI0038514A7C